MYRDWQRRKSQESRRTRQKYTQRPERLTAAEREKHKKTKNRAPKKTTRQLTVGQLAAASYQQLATNKKTTCLVRQDQQESNKKQEAAQQQCAVWRYFMLHMRFLYALPKPQKKCAAAARCGTWHRHEHKRRCKRSKWTMMNKEKDEQSIREATKSTSTFFTHTPHASIERQCHHYQH